MSHYKPYPAYRDSGVEWIGLVPEHWEVKRLRHVASFKNSNVDKKAYDGQEAVSLCNYTDVYYNEFITPDLPFMQATASAAEIEQFALSKGDVIITKDSEDPSDIGIPALVKDDLPGVICGYHLTMIRGADFDTSRLLHRILQSNPTQAHFFVEAPGITRYGLSQDAIGDLPFNFPPEKERNGIANAVDRETTRIDAMITKKTRFIELLKEKRQALITHAVTKGLNPDATMRESGVEWIGNVPEHWAVCKLSYRYSVELGKMLDEKRITGDHPVPYLRNKDVQWGEIKITDLPVMDISPDEIERYTIKNGDLLVCEGGDVGRAAIWRGDNNAIGYQKALHRLRSVSPDKDSVEFFAYVLGAAKRNGVFEESDTKSTISHLPAEKFREYRFAFPPLTEQAEIVASLNRDTARIDLLTEKTQRSIDLLKERRAAFITAAVTGQIDLRESA
ncbi:restriction endonuclease subunit S [Aeromonas caviae]|uniref:restriction endonuclease subunit S n=1 Tax=Aeromonas caviae TaxID=648 RepID=UPI001FC82988|nr:restriction endonuclease subunit S [Aeromonas caviae]GKR51833.1 restriction modification system DNA specificity domain-containing protein [Aeromonas caviae]